MAHTDKTDPYQIRHANPNVFVGYTNSESLGHKNGRIKFYKTNANRRFRRQRWNEDGIPLRHIRFSYKWDLT